MSNKYLCSPIGKKQLMALTGLGWCGFVFTHMAGNLVYFAGPEAYNAYSESITGNKELYYMIEAGLLAMLALHVLFAMMIVVANRRARPVGYAVGQGKSDKTAASAASRSMALTGTLVLVFIVFHLIHFRFGAFYPIQWHGFEIRDIARLMREFFQNGAYVAAYAVCLVALSFHLQHALWSSLQTLGWIPGGKEAALRCLSFLFGIGVSVGFVLTPLYIFFAQGGAQ